MTCAVSEGWQERIASKVQVAAASGFVGGGLYAVAKRGPPVQWAVLTTASFVICEATFAGLQETVRHFRCHVSPANSIVAGASAGYILTALHLGTGQARRMAGISAVICGLADILTDWLDVSTAWREALVSLDLLDTPASAHSSEGRPPDDRAAAGGAAVKEEEVSEEIRRARLEAPQYHHTGTWRDYLPVKKLSEEEWEVHKQRQAQKFKDRIDKARRGPSEDGT